MGDKPTTDCRRLAEEAGIEVDELSPFRSRETAQEIFAEIGEDQIAEEEEERDFARRAREARPAGLVSVYFDDCDFSDEETLLVLRYLAEVYRDQGGTGLKVAGGSTLVPSREEVAP